jgi:hypothetical protein
LVGHAAADGHPAEGGDAHGDDRGAGHEGERLRDRDQDAAGAQRDDGGQPATERLGALRSPRDLVLHEVRVQRAIRLVGHEVRREEDRQRDRGRADGADEAQQRQGEDQHRRGGEHERQPAADRRRQSVGP